MATKKRGFIKYKSYSFVNKDPVIDLLRTAKDDRKVTLEGIHSDSGVSVGTLHNWFRGKTRRPQFATVAAVARAMGCVESVSELLRRGR